jgi:hypothetical protein
VPQPTSANLDFRTDGPAPWCCDLCHKPYKGWEAPNEDWQKLPSEYQDLMLCEKDFRRLLREAGHDPRRVHITHKTHEYMQALWEEAQAYPAHHVKILFEGKPDRCMPGESLWCEVLEDCGNGEYVVRLRNTSIFHTSARAATLYLATWDRLSRHRPTGRPMFIPVRRLRKLPGKAKGNKGGRRR